MSTPEGQRSLTSQKASLVARQPSQHNWHAAPSVTLKYINSVCGAAICIWPAVPRQFGVKKPSAHIHLHEHQYC